MNDTATSQPMHVAVQKGADQKHCYSCGVIIHISAQSCPSCGATQPPTPLPIAAQPAPAVAPGQLPAHHVYCRGCGIPIHESAPTCPKCGALQTLSSVPRSPGGRERIAAALLAFFLGGFGGHKFYLGRIGSGILYLLFCWTFIPSFIAMIEGIIYLTMSDVEFSRKYG